MPAARRHARTREKMRDAIVAAARALFVRDGYANVSMRKIADRVGCSAASIYNYFPDKADVLFALTEDGFRRFARVMADTPPGADPLDALEGHFWRRYEFSKRYPEYFWLMFVDRSHERVAHDWEAFEPMREARESAARLLRRCMDAGVLPPSTDADEAGRVLATAVLGASVGRLTGRICHRRHADRLARQTLCAVIAGLRGPAAGPDRAIAPGMAEPAGQEHALRPGGPGADAEPPVN